MLYGSAKIRLNDLTDTQRSDLRTLVELSRGMYNLCTSAVIRHYEQTGRVLSYAELKAEVMNSHIYLTLGGQY